MSTHPFTITPFDGGTVLGYPRIGRRRGPHARTRRVNGRYVARVARPRGIAPRMGVTCPWGGA
jgi:hypothetical protein